MKAIIEAEKEFRRAKGVRRAGMGAVQERRKVPGWGRRRCGRGERILGEERWLS